MLLRTFLYCLICVTVSCCKNNNKKAERRQASQELLIKSSDIDDVDKDFNSFIERFSKDSVFQEKRTKFPLKFTQYDIGNDKDTILYKRGSEFEMIDFRKKKSNGRFEQWKQKIVLDRGGKKATIQIRGIENGIIVDCYFEKDDGKWTLVGVHDSST